MYAISKGTPQFGCQLNAHGANFGIYSDIAPAMVLEVYKSLEDSTPIVKIILKREDCLVEHVFHVAIEDITADMAYVWRILQEDGSYSPSVIDPYTYGVKQLYGEWRNSIVEQGAGVITKPHIPWTDTVIYELHVGHFTKAASSGVKEEERGTFKGLMEKIPYLKQLGVTALELLPIFMCNHFIVQNRNPETGELLGDIWGYNTIGFFALEPQYTVEKDSAKGIAEFKAFVEAAHQNHMEIILDVVYNHSGEGGMDRPSLSFRRLSNNTYYKMNGNGEYLNCSGTGNTLNTNQPIVKQLILDSLRYWTVQMGVDGFRFDLASILGQDAEGRWLKQSLLNEIAEDPVLSKVKLITESWDAKGSYDVGRMPLPFREWSDYFRDTVRKFVKGDQGNVKSVADCTLGKEIYFTEQGKNESHTIHFITAHDGFTMWDLLSYNEKHNLMNGENNRDGNNANYSYNWGIEGETDRPDICSNRIRAMKNFMCLLLLSRGVPMLLMGDEMARTQKGNNNAFCQDNETVWVDWARGQKYKTIFDFTMKLMQLRKRFAYFKAENIADYDVSWHGVHYTQPDWSYYSRSIAWCIKEPEGKRLYFIANSYHEPLRFELPPEAKKWRRVVDTHLEAPYDIDLQGIPINETLYEAAPYSFCVFEAEEPSED